MLRRSIPVFALLCLASAGLLPGCTSPEADQKIAAAIRKQVVEPMRWFQKRPTVDDDDIQPLVRSFYKARRYAPAWTHGDGPTAEARDLLQEIEHSTEHGLSPDQYHEASLKTAMEKGRAPLGGGPPVELAALDVALTRNFLKLGTHLSSGQVNPLQIPADWHVKPRRRDMVEILDQALASHRIGPTLESLAPRNPQYVALKNALAQYRQVAEQGGWPAIPDGPSLKRGTAGARVDSLQKRLMASGDLGPAHARGRFDASTQAAVQRFEARSGLEPKGIVGEEDRRELNFPIGTRIRQIELNMERWRWLADSPPSGRSVIVNIPDYSLRVVEDGRTVLAMRVVVGKDYSRTPMFTDAISYLVFNPNWNVPLSIASTEILAELQSDPAYLERHHMHLFENESENAKEIDNARIDWSSIDSTDFHYAIRQDPGPDNPVGHVKFMCPNQFNVYLHDTPAGQLFSARERTFSHGCIRVEKPVDLAAYLLRDKGWNADSVMTRFETADNNAVRLSEPVPLQILYWTAFADERGTIQFRDDVYGFDQLLDRTLRQHRPDIQSAVRTAYTPHGRRIPRKVPNTRLRTRRASA